MPYSIEEALTSIARSLEKIANPPRLVHVDDPEWKQIDLAPTFTNIATYLERLRKERDEDEKTIERQNGALAVAASKTVEQEETISHLKEQIRNLLEIAGRFQSAHEGSIEERVATARKGLDYVAGLAELPTDKRWWR